MQKIEYFLLAIGVLLWGVLSGVGLSFVLPTSPPQLIIVSVCAFALVACFYALSEKLDPVFPQESTHEAGFVSGVVALCLPLILTALLFSFILAAAGWLIASPFMRT